MKIDFISKNVLKRLKTREKIDMILRLVKNNTIIVLEGNLSPGEQIELVKETMRQIDPLSFIGVEIIDFTNAEKYGAAKNTASLTIIAPGGKVEVIKKTPNYLSMQIS